MKIAKAFLLCTLLSLLAVAQASAQAIVGAWSFGGIDTTKEGAAVFVFLANGCFYYIENVAKSEAPGGFAWLRARHLHVEPGDQRNHAQCAPGPQRRYWSRGLLTGVPT